MKKEKMLYPALGWFMALASCTATSEENKSTAYAKAVPVSRLVQMDTVIYKEYIADIQSQRNVELRSRLAGFLSGIHVDEGAHVKKGQILFSLNDEEYKTDLAQAQAALNRSKAEETKVTLELERTRKLVDKEIVSRTEYDLLEVQLKAAQSNVQEAEAVLQQARTKLGYTQIRAPFSGRIDRILLKEGSLLSEGSLITTISDLEKVNVYFNISESEYLEIASEASFDRNNFKQDVRLILANGEVYPLQGTAELVESEFQTSTGSISLRAKFDNPDGLLKHGASGRIGVPTNTGNLTFVHQKSVFEIQDKAYVYVLAADNKIKMTPFKHGQRVGHYYIVEEGLQPETKVVYEGVQSLRDDMVVQPEEIDNI